MVVRDVEGACPGVALPRLRERVAEVVALLDRAASLLDRRLGVERGAIVKARVLLEAKPDGLEVGRRVPALGELRDELQVLVEVDQPVVEAIGDLVAGGVGGERPLGRVERGHRATLPVGESPSRGCLGERAEREPEREW